MSPPDSAHPRHWMWSIWPSWPSSCQFVSKGSTTSEENSIQCAHAMRATRRGCLSGCGTRCGHFCRRGASYPASTPPWTCSSSPTLLRFWRLEKAWASWCAAGISDLIRHGPLSCKGVRNRCMQPAGATFSVKDRRPSPRHALISKQLPGVTEPGRAAGRADMRELAHRCGCSHTVL